MNKHYSYDDEADTDTQLSVRPGLAAALIVAVLGLFASRADAEARLGSWSDASGRWEGERSDANVLICSSPADCKTKLEAYARTYGVTRTSGYAYIGFQSVMRVDFVKPAPTPVCAAPRPLAETRTATCPAPTIGTYGQKREYVAAAYPTCWVQGTTWSNVQDPTTVCAQPPAPSNSATLRWTPPTQNTDGTPLTNLQSYVIHYGASRESLTRSVPLFVPNATTYIIEGLTPGTWYFAIKAVAATGAESSLSSIASKVIG